MTADLAQVAETLAQAVQRGDTPAADRALAPLTAFEVHALVLVLAARYPAAPLCRNCGTERQRRTSRDGYLGARDLCRPCYDRARAAGFPEIIPPAVPRSMNPAFREALQRKSEDAAERRARYLTLRARRWSPQAAADEVWVSLRTAYRYEAWQREQQAAESDVAA